MITIQNDSKIYRIKTTKLCFALFKNNIHNITA